ncbi:hypothetical protein [Thermoplasma sp. Kam2015]|nr:hypothetical protein [Thermoplasma sp. Kam2015]
MRSPQLHAVINRVLCGKAELKGVNPSDFRMNCLIVSYLYPRVK